MRHRKGGITGLGNPEPCGLDNNITLEKSEFSPQRKKTSEPSRGLFPLRHLTNYAPLLKVMPNFHTTIVAYANLSFLIIFYGVLDNPQSPVDMRL